MVSRDPSLLFWLFKALHPYYSLYHSYQIPKNAQINTQDELQSNNAFTFYSPCRSIVACCVFD